MVWNLLKHAVAIIVLAALAACAQTQKKTTPEDVTMASEPAKTADEPAHFLALGDSYTIGEMVASDQRWPAILVRRLRKEEIKIAAPKIIAKTGWTTEELATAIEKANLKPPYDLVSLLIGVNDQYRGYDIDDYDDRFEDLLEQAIEFAGDNPARVIVVSIPDWSVTPYARKDERSRETIAEQIAAYNRINRRIAEEYGVHYINITDISQRVDEDITLVANDGLHPSGRQYHRWVARILPVAREILSSDKP